MNNDANKKQRTLSEESRLETLHQILHLSDSQMRHLMSKSIASGLRMKRWHWLSKHMIWYVESRNSALYIINPFRACVSSYLIYVINSCSFSHLIFVAVHSLYHLVSGNYLTTPFFFQLEKKKICTENTTCRQIDQPLNVHAKLSVTFGWKNLASHH